jgi:phosphatidylglycerophosphate synthase
VTFGDHLDRWQALHGGHDPRSTPLLIPWLRVVHLLAARLPVSPDLLTALAVVVAAAVLVVPAWAGALLVLLSALLDGLDGAVAIVRDRVTRHGAVLDAVGDRICDVLFVTALVLAGAPPWLGMACAAGILLLEGTRLVTRRIGVITVAERPTRVLATALGLVSVPTVGLVVLTGATALGLLQLGGVAGRAPARQPSDSQ